MTSNPTPNHKIWRLAWPMIISNLSVPLLGIVDTAILGHLPDARYLAAVAVGSSILAFLYWGFGFLRMGTTGLAAQAFGGGQPDELRRIIAQAIVFGVTAGLMVLLLSPALIEVGLQLVTPPPGSEGPAAVYCQIRIFSAPAVMINYAVTGWLIGRQNTLWPLAITLLTNLLNILLDLLLIIGLGLNSEGAALATLIAEYCGCGVGLLVLHRQLAGSPGALARQRLWHWPDYQHLIRVNRHLFIRTIALLASFAFFTAQGAAQGETILAANTILLQLLMTVAFGLDGFAHAAEALTGDAVGKRDYSLFFATCRQCGWWSLLTAGLFTTVYLLLGPAILGLMTSIDAVRITGLEYLPWLIALPLIAVASYLLDGIFIGATQTGAMQSTMLLSAGLVYLPCWYLTRDWGNHGLWLAFVLFSAGRGVFLGIRFLQLSRRRAWW